jgi:hypothetical protein
LRDLPCKRAVEIDIFLKFPLRVARYSPQNPTMTGERDLSGTNDGEATSRFHASK